MNTDATMNTDKAASLCAVLMMCFDEAQEGDGKTFDGLPRYAHVAAASGYVTVDEVLTFMFALDMLKLIDLQEPPVAVMGDELIAILKAHKERCESRPVSVAEILAQIGITNQK